MLISLTKLTTDCFRVKRAHLGMCDCLYISLSAEATFDMRIRDGCRYADFVNSSVEDSQTTKQFFCWDVLKETSRSRLTLFLTVSC